MAAIRTAFSLMPSLASKSRPALKNIGNADDTSKLKAAKKPSLAPTTAPLEAVLAPAAFSVAQMNPKEAVAPALDDALPMEVDQLVLPPGVEDIDMEEADNPMMVAEYVNEIYAYLREVETRNAVGENYMTGVQQEINGKMRGILVDWLVEVHMRFKLLQETLFMTIDIIDRFLAIRNVPRNKLQLVGITAMLIASKYEEMYPPEVRDFVYIADNAYSRTDIFAMEALILRVLDFNLSTPLSLHFLRRCSRACHADTRVHSLAKYFLEVKMMSYKMAHVKPSATAAASVWLARRILEPTEQTWTPTAEYYSDYSEAQLQPIIAGLQAELVAAHQPAQSGAVRKKYASSRLMSVSDLPELRTFLASQH
eukprot:m.57548 g.57548  ORF g.57548 m.57548 type:complete len:367 (+) comp12113_c0_seq2:88-1188(+)